MIERFRNLTGVPMVLNTSCNENKLVVCRPAEPFDYSSIAVLLPLARTGQTIISDVRRVIGGPSLDTQNIEGCADGRHRAS